MATISLASKWAEEREGRESENCWRYLWTLLEREERGRRDRDESVEVTEKGCNLRSKFRNGGRLLASCVTNSRCQRLQSSEELFRIVRITQWRPVQHHRTE